MSELDTADALLGDDDGEDYDLELGKEEEAKLLYGDDEDDADLLEEEQEQDRRDKFASERTHEDAEHEQFEQTNWTNNTKDNHRSGQERFNRSRGNGMRGNRGRGRGIKHFNNGHGRIGVGKCYVNPSLLQGVKKPVQSVQPWLNQPSNTGNFENNRAPAPTPFINQQRQIYHQQPQPQQYNQMQSFGPQQNHWQPPPQNHMPIQQQPQYFYDGPRQQGPIQPQPPQQCYQPNIQHPQPFNQHNQHQFYEQPNLNYNSNQNFNSNYQPQSLNFQPPQQNLHNAPAHFNHQNQMSQHSQPTHNMHMQSNQQQTHHAPLHMGGNMQHPQHLQHQSQPMNSGFYDNFNSNTQNIQGQHQNLQQNINPAPILNHAPQRHSGPLLQRPPLLLTHDEGHFRPQPVQRFNHNEEKQRGFNHHNQQEFNRPRGQGQHHQGRFQYGGHKNHYGGQTQNFNNRQDRHSFKRRNDWHEEQNEEYTKRKSWNYNNDEYNEQEYYEEEEPVEHEHEEEQPQQQQQNIKVAIALDNKPEIEEDEETKAYRLQIEEQKRKREQIWAEKERKRKLAILKQNGEITEIPALQVGQQPRARIVNRVSASNPNLRLLTRSDSDLSTSSVTKVKIRPGVAPTKLSTGGADGDKPKLSSGFLSNRKVIAKDDSLLDTSVVIVRNLAASSAEPLRKLCHGVGLVQSLEMSSKERQAMIRFKSVASAHAFYKKYQRHMLDLSMIQVELVADNKP